MPIVGGYEAPGSDGPDIGGTSNGAPNHNLGWAPITIMGDTVTPRSTNVMHVAFPVSKSAVRNFRGELEENIEFRPTKSGGARLRDLLVPGSSGFNKTGPFPTPRGFEQPLIMRNGQIVSNGTIHMDDLVSSPVNAEATPASSQMPI